MAQGTLLKVRWQPGREGNLGENRYMYIYGQAPLLFTVTLLTGYTPIQNKKF